MSDERSSQAGRGRLQADCAIAARKRLLFLYFVAVDYVVAQNCRAYAPQIGPAYNQSPQVANIPTAAAAITKVANQPSVFSSGFNVN